MGVDLRNASKRKSGKALDYAADSDRTFSAGTGIIA